MLKTAETGGEAEWYGGGSGKSTAAADENYG